MAAEFVNIGDAVEGSKVEIYTRKETWKGMRLDPMTKKVMMVCELDRNCRNNGACHFDRRTASST